MKEVSSKVALEAQARREYQALLGKCVSVWALSGYVGDDSVDKKLKEPVRVRIERTSDDCVCRWNDGWLDPVYEVTVLGEHQEVGTIRSAWIYGTCRHPDGSVESSDLVMTPLVLGPDDRKKRRFVVELKAAGVTVTAGYLAVAQNYAKEDAREFAGQWNYTVGDVLEATSDDPAGCTPQAAGKEATPHISDLDFKVKHTGGRSPHFEFTVSCRPVVLAEDEADAIVQMVSLLGSPPQADESRAQVEGGNTKRFRQRPVRAGRSAATKASDLSRRDELSALATAGDAAAFAEGLRGVHILYASEGTNREFTSVTGRSLHMIAGDDTPAAEACWMTLPCGRRILAEGPYQVELGMLRVGTPLEQEAAMLVRPMDIVSVEFTE